MVNVLIVLILGTTNHKLSSLENTHTLHGIRRASDQLRGGYAFPKILSGLTYLSIVFWIHHYNSTPPCRFICFAQFLNTFQFSLHPRFQRNEHCSRSGTNIWFGVIRAYGLASGFNTILYSPSIVPRP